jgi:hypothetical protein
MTEPVLKSIRTGILLSVALAGTAHADIWRWVDALGETRYVDTVTPIYTWLDESGRVWFSDTPDHEKATKVELLWHSDGDSVEEAEQAAKKGDRWAYAGESASNREERESAEDYYCDRAREIYDSYQNAPRLYKTNDAGERVYLTDEESTATLAETKSRVDDLCNT